MCRLLNCIKKSQVEVGRFLTSNNRKTGQPQKLYGSLPQMVRSNFLSKKHSEVIEVERGHI